MKLSQLFEVRSKSDERIKLIDNDEILAVVPLTVEASCKYGANTKWCTAARGNNHFKSYEKRLIYVILKKYNREQYGSYKLAIKLQRFDNQGKIIRSEYTLYNDEDLANPRPRPSSSFKNKILNLMSVPDKNKIYMDTFDKYKNEIFDAYDNLKLFGEPKYKVGDTILYNNDNLSEVIGVKLVDGKWKYDIRFKQNPQDGD